MTDVDLHEPLDHALFEREKWPFYWLTRVVGRYLEQMGLRLKKVGLDVSRWRVLMCLSVADGVSVSEIAELAIVKLPTMMKIVQRMEADGLVVMAPRATDGRVTEVMLTARGRVKRDEALAIARKVHEQCFAKTPADKRQALNEHLRQIFECLDG